MLFPLKKREEEKKQNKKKIYTKKNINNNSNKASFLNCMLYLTGISVYSHPLMLTNGQLDEDSL